MSIRVIILTGAPRPSSLKWDSADLLQHPQPFIAPPESSTCDTLIRWRSLASPPPFTIDEHKVGETTLFTGGKIDRHSGLIIDEDEETLSEFYEHSFAIHEGIGSFAQGDGSTLDDETKAEISFLDGSLNDTTGSPSSPESTRNPFKTPAAIGHLSDLEDLPDAHYLRSIAPRVVSVNLVVVIIHISPRRRVQTRWGRQTDIMEILVADETRSGFRVTCWLPAATDGAKQTPLEQSLAGLRLRDIVLFQSVALTSFRQRVYGQTLRYNMTKVHLLSRRPVDITDDQGLFRWKKVVESNATPDRLLQKVRKVRRWILDFVAPAADKDSEGSLSGDEEAARDLPPDSQ
ncbi:hypothetical protein VTO42DRAFT_5511 [Malbranchea cinnamomea]